MNNKGKALLPTTSLFIMIAFFLFFYPLYDFGLTYIVGAGITVCLWAFGAIVKNKRIVITKTKLLFLGLTLVLGIIWIMPYSRHEAGNSGSLILNFLFNALLIITSDLKKEEFDMVFRIVIRLAVVIGTTYLVLNLFPSIYRNFVLPFATSSTRSYANNLLSAGYGLSISKSPIYVDYVVLLFSMFTISEIFVLRKNESKSNYYALMIICLLNLVLQGRRGELLSGIIALFGVIIFYIISKGLKINIKTILFALVTFIIMYLGIKALVNNGYLVRLKRLFEDLQVLDIQSEKDINSISSGRIGLWKEAFRLFKENPIFGIGWGQFYLKNETKAGVANVHNTYIQFLCETGIVGTVCILFIIFTLLYRTVRVMISIIRNNKNRSKEAYQAIVISFGIQLFFIVLNAFDPSFYKNFSSYLLAMCFILTDFAEREMESYISK